MVLKKKITKNNRWAPKNSLLQLLLQHPVKESSTRGRDAPGSNRPKQKCSHLIFTDSCTAGAGVSMFVQQWDFHVKSVPNYCYEEGLSTVQTADLGHKDNTPYK